MKSWTFLAACLLAAQACAQTVERMDELQPQQKADATELTLTGQLSTRGNSDFRQLRDLCWQLRRLDLSGARCTDIPDNAFHSRHRLEAVLLPKKLRTVGSQAFFACTALRELTLPATVEAVETAAFSMCTGLEELTIEGTPQLGDFAFAHLRSLRRLTLRSAVPPPAAPTAFEGIDRRKVEIEVPRGSERLYRKAQGWARLFGPDPAAGSLCEPEQVLAPMPAKLERCGGEALTVNRRWEVAAGPDLANETGHAMRLLAQRLFPNPDAPKPKGSAVLRLDLDASLGHPEAYTLEVAADGVRIAGGGQAGVFYGLMTFDQLLRGDAATRCCAAIPLLRIEDRPRTEVRELMVDPCRTFIPFEELKAFVPEMARYKLNALHLHLVDDQAWRIEIKAYPELTERASARVGMDDMLRPESGFYTQEQMRELVALAARYHVQVVPEIEMPGHEVAAIHVFPQLTCHAKEVPIRTTCGVSDELLCPGSEFTYEFLGKVFAELAEVFPSPYVHLGGDEAGNPALDCWTSCPNCQALKQRLGITSTDRSENWRLQEYLFNRVIDTLRTRHGKTPMFWYETDFKRIQPGCVTFAWRHGLTRAALDAAVANEAKIMLCPGEHCYLDYPMAPGDMPEVNWGMPVTSLKATYSLDPAWGMGEEFERKNLFGVAGTLWSECINSPERIYYQAYPRAIALAEVGWSPAAVRSWEGFLLRLAPVVRDMQRRGISCSLRYEGAEGFEAK